MNFSQELPLYYGFPNYTDYSGEYYSSNAYNRTISHQQPIFLNDIESSSYPFFRPVQNNQRILSNPIQNERVSHYGNHSTLLYHSDTEFNPVDQVLPLDLNENIKTLPYNPYPINKYAISRIENSSIPAITTLEPFGKSRKRSFETITTESLFPAIKQRHEKKRRLENGKESRFFEHNFESGYSHIQLDKMVNEKRQAILKDPTKLVYLKESMEEIESNYFPTAKFSRIDEISRLYCRMIEALFRDRKGKVSAGKDEYKKIKNMFFARRSRKCKLNKIETLENKLADLSDKKNKLEEEVQSLRNENSDLRLKYQRLLTESLNYGIDYSF